MHALLADQLPKDNNGLIVGERAALLVDAGVVDLGNFSLRRRLGHRGDRRLHHLAFPTLGLVGAHGTLAGTGAGG